MEGDGTAADSVGEDIERLEDRFGSFPVNQTTLDVSEACYESARERAGAEELDVYVRVRNDDGEVLHVGGDEGGSVPQCVSGPNEPLSAAVTRTVRTETGVECAVDDVARVTITGVRDEDDPDAEAIYRLVALVDARHERGRARGAEWRPDDAALPEYV